MPNYVRFASLMLCIAIAIPASAQQPNSAAASLVISGTGAAPAPGPFAVRVPSGIPTTLSATFSGPANTPWALFNANPALGGFIALGGGVGTPFGIVDLAPIAFPPIEIVLDGIANAGNIIGAIANTGTAGSSSIPMTVTPLACPVTLANLQAILPTVGPPGFTLTAAFIIGSGIPDFAPVTVPPGDDVSTAYPLASCGGFPFYGISQPTYNINSNGNITFGGADTTFGESQAGFNSGLPRVAPIWDDMYTYAGMPITKLDAGGIVTITWNAVPEFVAVGANTFSVSLATGSGDVSFTFTGPMSMLDGITGITPGGGLAAPVTVFGLASPNLRISNHLPSGVPALGPYIGGPMESMNEVFTAFNLVGLTVTFMATGPTSYTMM